ncbi:biotin--[acetyl-CoA-carboxylase] ligase [Pasteurellaceae bacterium Macca]|nr:biotin--[acetyl-CoA-carboxylase] ligase [Pasteurellaceae bacterium Macca]
MKLNITALREALPQGEVRYFEEINSTNDYLLTHCQTLPSGSLCIAESQTAGRGRRGRQWYSPQRENLYFSLLWHYDLSVLPTLSSFSLSVAVIIAETFQALGVSGIQIKWPNDIYYQGKKMGGILNETKCDKSGVSLVIGIGLNLAMEQVDESIVTQDWADLSAYQLNREQLLMTLAQRLQQALQTYPISGFTPYVSRWQHFDCFANQPVKLISENRVERGIQQGINEQGELLLAQHGVVRAFAVGELSLRRQ